MALGTSVEGGQLAAVLMDDLLEQVGELSDSELTLLSDYIKRLIDLRREARLKEKEASRVDLAFVLRQAVDQLGPEAARLADWLDDNPGKRVMIDLDLSESASPVLNAQEAGEMLRVTARTIQNMIKEGKIPARKVGRAWRIKRRDLLDYLNRPYMDG